MHNTPTTATMKNVVIKKLEIEELFALKADMHVIKMNTKYIIQYFLDLNKTSAMFFINSTLFIPYYINIMKKMREKF